LIEGYLYCLLLHKIEKYQSFSVEKGCKKVLMPNEKFNISKSQDKIKQKQKL